MLEATFSSIQIEQLFWARPLPTLTMGVIFVGILVLSAYLYRRSWGLKNWSRGVLGLIRMVVLALIVAITARTNSGST